MKHPLFALPLLLAVSAVSAQETGKMQTGGKRGPSPVSESPVARKPELQPTGVTNASPPCVELKERLTDPVPARIARRLSILLGVEVRLPARQRTAPFAFEAGRRTPVALLNEVAHQMHGSWSVEFHFRPSSGSTSADRKDGVSTSKLPSAGTIPVLIQQRTFGRAARALGDAVGCRMVLLGEPPAGRFSLQFRERVPVEIALTSLAAQAGWAVSPVVVFETPTPVGSGEETGRDAEQIRRTVEKQTSKSELTSWLETSYGVHPSSEAFPWNNIDLAQIAPTLQYQLDLSRQEVDELFGQLRLEAQSVANSQ